VLPYAAQIAELEKIEKLSPRPIVTRELPGLVPSSGKCLVCGKRPARACAACGAVSYCGVEHQQKDARWHDRVCNAFREIADATGAEQRALSDLHSRPLTIKHVIETLGIRGQPNVHVMAAAQRELSLSAEVWALSGARVSLIGPELPHKSKSALPTRRAPYSRALWSALGEPDLVIGFNCGLMMYPSWKATILDLRGSGVPFAITSYRDWEAAAEARLLSAVNAVCLLPPAPNPWASRLARRSTTIANDLSYDNAYVSAWR
jgi:hypothetical protein